MGKDAQLEIKKLTIGIGSEKKAVPVVNQISFSIQPGQCVGVVGESGSGKTMTALSIMQLLPYAAWVSQDSQIWFQGKNLLDYTEKSMRRIRGIAIGMIFQDAMSAFNPVLTVGHQMQEILQGKLHLSYRYAKKRACDLLNEVGISDPARTYRAYSHQLSGGMRQRAMIAMALCGEPSMIIADEPTTAVDVTIQKQILLLLHTLKERKNISLLFISHDLSVISQIADESVVLKSGELVEKATPAVFFKRPLHEYSQQLLSAILTTTPRKTYWEPPSRLLSVNRLKVYFPIRKGIFKRKIGDVKAVDGISFSLGEKQTMALVGESGSGKTTTAKAISQLIHCTAGEIIFDNNNLSNASRRAIRERRRDFQIIFQDPYSALNPRMLVGDSIAEGMSIQNRRQSRKSQLARVDELLALVGLLPSHKWRYPHEFSGGERQRICIARALALQPKLLILDEPTSALDVSIQQQVLQLLEKIQEEYGLSYLLITHNLSVVAYLSHYLAVMYQGKIVEQGPTELLLRAPQHNYTKKLLGAIPKIAYYSGLEPV